MKRPAYLSREVADKQYIYSSKFFSYEYNLR